MLFFRGADSLEVGGSVGLVKVLGGWVRIG